jgi:hypothetical protein
VKKELLEERDGKGVCFIFDDYERFSPQDGHQSIVHKIINKEYLHQSSVVVVSRPAAIMKLRRRANKIIEVLGFSDKHSVSEYFDHYPFSADSYSKDLKSRLQLYPNTLSMCYLPVHTAMVAFMFDFSGELPKTETEVYSHFKNFTLTRNFTDGVGLEGHNLSMEEKLLFDQICDLALEGTIASMQVMC